MYFFHDFGYISKEERTLWRAVILQAMLDAVNRSSHPEMRKERHAARQWLSLRNRDFFTVCDYAGLDPGAVRKAALRLIPPPRCKKPRRPRIITLPARRSRAEAEAQ